MATRGRDVLKGRLSHRLKKGNGGFKKKRVVCAFSGIGGSGNEDTKKISAQILFFDDYEKVEKPGSKPKNSIRLEGAKIESSCSSPSASNTSSPAYSSAVASPQSGGMRLSTSPSQNGGETYSFTVATGNSEVHEFKVETENDRLRWVKILQLLVMYPFSPIPEEPNTNPIKDSFRKSLEAQHYRADSVWPVYILPEEVGSKSGILGLHILALRSGIPNVSMGQLDIISPSDHTPVVTWDRDKMRRTGKTGHLVFIEIGRRCEGGPGLVWMYTGYQNDAQALRETLHKFLFHGDGKAVAMDSQSQSSTYDVPRASIDSQPRSFHKRSSIPSGYQNHLLRSRSQDHDSGYHSVSEKTPPALEGPPVRLDKHPSIRRKHCNSEPCVMRRRSSNVSNVSNVQSPCGSYSDKDMFECDDSVSRHNSHSTTPPDDSEGYVTGAMDGDTESVGMAGDTRLYDVVRDSRSATVGPGGHPYYIPQAPPTATTDGAEPTGEEYMRMVHPRGRSEGGYVVMKPVLSPQKSSTIPVPLPQKQANHTPSPSSSPDEYNTLQHFVRQPSASRAASSLTYDTLPTINERQQLHRDNYENFPLPSDLKGVVPRAYHPNYENQHESSFKGRRGSHGQDSYENVSSAQQAILVNSD